MSAVIGWYREHVWALVPTVYVAMSFVTFIVYAMDKRAARRGAWRTPESTLHLLELLCGWPGAWFAQRVLRHKSVKTSFRIVFFIAVVLNLVGLGFVVWWMARGT